MVADRNGPQKRAWALVNCWENNEILGLYYINKYQFYYFVTFLSFILVVFVYP